jgi:hypothetical protein
MITNCNIGATGTSCISHRDRRATCAVFIVSSLAADMQVAPIRRALLTIRSRRIGKIAKSICYNARTVNETGLFDMERTMERAVALKKLGKLLGKSLGYRVDPRGLNAEDRDAAVREAKALSAEYKLAEEAEAARRKAILEGDAEYQRLRTEAKRLRDAKDTAWSKSRHFKFTVGTSNGIFFHVRAQGDSWEEVIETVISEQAGRKAA